MGWQRKVVRLHERMLHARASGFIRMRGSLESGAGSRRPPNSSIALHAASFHGHLVTVRYLLDKGSDVKLMNDHGRTAVDRANDGGHPCIIKYLRLSTPGISLLQRLSVQMAWLSTLVFFCLRHLQVVCFRVWLCCCRMACIRHPPAMFLCHPRPFGLLFQRAFRHNSHAKNAWILRDLCLNKYKSLEPQQVLEPFEAWQRNVIFKTLLRVELAPASILALDMRSTVIVTNHPPSPALDHMMFQWMFPHLSVHGMVRKDYYDGNECIFHTCRWIPIHSPLLHGQDTTRIATESVAIGEEAAEILAKGNAVWISAERGWTTHRSADYSLATGAFRIAGSAANAMQTPIRVQPFFIAFTGHMKRRLMHVVQLEAVAVPPRATRADISKAREMLTNEFLRLHAEHQLPTL